MSGDLPPGQGRTYIQSCVHKGICLTDTMPHSILEVTEGRKSTIAPEVRLESSLKFRGGEDAVRRGVQGGGCPKCTLLSKKP